MVWSLGIGCGVREYSKKRKILYLKGLPPMLARMDLQKRRPV
jgi:hypothetical protein